MDKKTLQDWFTGWQVYASESRDCKQRTEKLKQAIRAKKIQKALMRWKMRTEKFIEYDVIGYGMRCDDVA